MAKFVWHSGDVPQNLKVTQVYGIVFNADGLVLLKVENKKDRRVYSFGGGTPENFDDSRETTLRREMMEELNTTLQSKLISVGYQEVNEENGKPPYAQMRMTALVDKVGAKQPDPDNGDTYDRLFTTPNQAIKLLGWGDVGKNQILEAVKLAQKHFGIKIYADDEQVEQWV